MKDINELALSITEPLDENALFTILGGKGGESVDPLNFYLSCSIIIQPKTGQDCYTYSEKCQQCGQCAQCAQCAKCGQCGD